CSSVPLWLYCAQLRPNRPCPATADGVAPAAGHKPARFDRNEIHCAHGTGDTPRVTCSRPQTNKIEQGYGADRLFATHSSFHLIPKWISIVLCELDPGQSQAFVEGGHCIFPSGEAGRSASRFSGQLFTRQR